MHAKILLAEVTGPVYEFTNFVTFVTDTIEMCTFHNSSTSLT